MRRILVFISLALSQGAAGSPDGGVGIFSQCAEPPSGDAPLAADGGWWLSGPRAAYDACRIGAGTACGQALDLQAADGGWSTSTLVIGGAVGLVIDLAVIYFSSRISRHLPVIP